LKEDEILQLGRRFALLTYEKGALIFSQGESVVGCHIICEGRAKLYQRTREGKKQLLKLLNPGDILVNELLAGEDWYNTSVEALEEVKTLLIGVEEFFVLLEKYPTVSRRVFQRLAQDCLETQQKLTRISYENDEKVLGRLLLDLAAHYGVQQEGKVIIDLELITEELAEMVGTARETITRCLKDLKERRLVTRQGRKLVILDEKNLRDFLDKDRV